MAPEPQLVAAKRRPRKKLPVKKTSLRRNRLPSPQPISKRARYNNQKRTVEPKDDDEPEQERGLEQEPEHEPGQESEQGFEDESDEDDSGDGILRTVAVEGRVRQKSRKGKGQSGRNGRAMLLITKQRKMVAEYQDAERQKGPAPHVHSKVPCVWKIEDEDGSKGPEFRTPWVEFPTIQGAVQEGLKWFLCPWCKIDTLIYRLLFIDHMSTLCSGLRAYVHISCK